MRNAELNRPFQRCSWPKPDLAGSSASEQGEITGATSDISPVYELVDWIIASMALFILLID